MKDDTDEKPPIFGSWAMFYGVVILELIFLIVFFYFFSAYFKDTSGF